MPTRLALPACVAVLFVALTALVAAPAEAQAGPPSSVRLDVHGDFGWYKNGGLGVRVDIPLVREGFLRARGVRDDLSLSPGAELFWWYTSRYEGIGFIPMVMAQWNIYFAQRWSFMLEAGLAVLMGPANWNRDYYASYIAPVGQLGFRWHFSDANALLLRVGWPAGLQLGVTFDL